MSTNIHEVSHLHMGDIAPVSLISLFDTDEITRIRISEIVTRDISIGFPGRIGDDLIRSLIRCTYRCTDRAYPSFLFTSNENGIIFYQIGLHSSEYTLPCSHLHTSRRIDIADSFIFHLERSIMHDICRSDIEGRTSL